MSVHKWAVLQSLAMFSPDNLSSRSWHNLILIALTNSPSAIVPLEHAVTDHNELSIIDFRLVTIVVISERILDSQDTPDDVKVFIRSLWQTWSSLIDNDPVVHATIIRPIITSFFRKSTLLVKDAALVYPQHAEAWRRHVLIKCSRAHASSVAAFIGRRQGDQLLPTALMHLSQFGRSSAHCLSSFRLNRALSRIHVAEPAGLSYSLDILA